MKARMTINDMPLTDEQIKTIFHALEFYAEQEQEWIDDCDPETDAAEIAEKAPQVEACQTLMDMIDPQDDDEIAASDL